MSEKIKNEYTQLLCECERVQTSKMWKDYQQFVLNIKLEPNLDREDTIILVQGLIKLGLYEQAFNAIDKLDNRDKKENKLWYEAKTYSEKTGYSPKVFKYLTSKKFDVDRLCTKLFRDEITNKFAQTKKNKE